MPMTAAEILADHAGLLATMTGIHKGVCESWLESEVRIHKAENSHALILTKYRAGSISDCFVLAAEALSRFACTPAEGSA